MLSAKSGRYRATGSSHDTAPWDTSMATTVADSDFEIDAIWNTVRASTGAFLPTSRVP
ncbi:hypothetical protein D3C81_2307050 [compost metagenome]